MSIQEDAKEKITREMASGGCQRHALGVYIIEQLLTNDENAEKVLQPSKNLTGAISEIRNKAKKAAIDGMAMIEDYEVFGWVREYFGISDLTVVKPAAPASPPDDLANISLYDLM